MKYLDALLLTSRLHLLDEPEQDDAPPTADANKPTSGSILDLTGDH